MPTSERFWNSCKNRAPRPPEVMPASADEAEQQQKGRRGVGRDENILSHFGFLAGFGIGAFGLRILMQAFDDVERSGITFGSLIRFFECLDHGQEEGRDTEETGEEHEELGRFHAGRINVLFMRGQAQQSTFPNVSEGGE